MYPSSTSSSSQTTSSGGGGRGPIRYASAPDSLLTMAVDTGTRATHDFSTLGAQTHHIPARFFHSESYEMATRQNHNPSKRGNRSREEQANTTIGLQPSYGFGGASSSAVVRHSSSSPAGFHNQLAGAAGDRNGFSANSNSKGIAETTGGGGGGGSVSRLNSQLISFTGKESLSRISQGAEEVAAAMDSSKKPTHSYAATSGGAAAFSMWPEPSGDHITFSVEEPSRGKHVNNGLVAIESQFQWSISQAAQEMASMEKLVNLPQDSVTCRIRAKRGCATHPRSIAERERRTRISGKLKKLQDVVPNMDKQTCYSDMLDVAVQHIKSLQAQVEKLHKSLNGCTCGSKKPADS